MYFPTFWFLLCFLILVGWPGLHSLLLLLAFPCFRSAFCHTIWPLSFSSYHQYFSLDNPLPTLCYYFIFTFVNRDVPSQVTYNFRNAVSRWSDYVLHKGGNWGSNGGSLKSSPLCAGQAESAWKKGCLF